ncbi:DNA polymerase ligase N-terminal domain-containing protein [Catenuloplanes indicus]|uniref:Bifunctional non-homologous end joining protein LigD n=1 Tax=Catenuloplanes indicus TaxID=137267 RepID=A0AAE3VZ46_9ACTN|nr:DNA polymerase ligase N-terminal domain-containing protein [Catenuloplanes indicus]MDQ0366516.1 bifunctional non-homologous end joining protein LigD [Catenuloplanes indicus]
MGDRLDAYRGKRDARRTPEPMPGRVRFGAGDSFVIHQHHARRLHWDLRLERDGVLVSWAVPRGLPRDPHRNHLAVHTEDHPLEYATFAGEIPPGEYGGGTMKIFDRGRYEVQKWGDDEVVVLLRGDRVHGRYALFRTRDRDWMIHRMDPADPGWTPMPEHLLPVRPIPAARLPAGDADWAYEMEWDGARVLACVEGGRLRLLDADGHDLGGAFGELRGLAEALAPTECVLDGVVVAFDREGHVSRAALRSRLEGAARRRAGRAPVQLLVFDLLWLEGRSTEGLGYADRRSLLADLDVSGESWQTPPYFSGGGAYAVDAARAHELPAVIAKRLDAPYRPGSWLRVSV